MLFLEHGREKEKEKNVDVHEKHRLVVSHMLLPGKLDPKISIFPDWESNWQTLFYRMAPNPLIHNRQGIDLWGFLIYNKFYSVSVYKGLKTFSERHDFPRQMFLLFFRNKFSISGTKS